MGEVGVSQLKSLNKRTNKLLTEISKCNEPIALRIHRVVRSLPCLIAMATAVLSKRRQLMKQQHELPTRRQWVPIVLWKIYDAVANSAGNDVDKKPLMIAMHNVLKTIKETDPFFYLQVVYQSPPKQLNMEWKVRASAKLTMMATSMTPYFQVLRQRSSALRNKYDARKRIHNGWNDLRTTMVFVKRAARHFHKFILYLYAVAMGRDVSNAHDEIISEKAATLFLTNDVEVRARLRLSCHAATSEDSLIRESYEWTPELLVYLDEWRWHRKSRSNQFGFDHRERCKDFLPRFSIERPSQRLKKQAYVPRFDVLAEIGYKLRKLDRVWLASRLGTSSFASMRIEDIGVLEQEIKSSFGAVVDLVYRMMLARWMVRKRSTEWWTSLKLCGEVEADIKADLSKRFDSVSDDYTEKLQATTSEVSALTTKKLDDDVYKPPGTEIAEYKRMREYLPIQEGFRPPTSVKFRTDAHALESLKCVVPQSLAFKQSFGKGNGFEAFDQDIRKRVDMMRVAMLGLRDQLKSYKVSESLSESKRRSAVDNDWRVTHFGSHAIRLVNQAVQLAEDTAQHCLESGKIPSVRQTEDKSVSVLDIDDQLTSQPLGKNLTLKELYESLQKAKHNVAEMVLAYDVYHSSQWRDAIISIGLTTVKLLRIIAHDEAAEMCRLAED